MEKKRIVITGIGSVTPLGNELLTTWTNLISGKCGIDRITRFNTEHPNFKSKVAGEVKDFNPLNYGMKKKDIRKLDLFVQYGLAATEMALQDSGLELGSEHNDHIGAIIGSGMGGMITNQEQHRNLLEMYDDRIEKPSIVSPQTIPKMMVNALPGQISQKYKITGVTKTASSACASGNSAIIEAYKTIQYGPEKVIITGGAEAVITDLGNVAFANMTALSNNYNNNPKKASMPFNKKRSGFVMGEGAGILVIEELEHALKREAYIYAEILGFAETSDGHHITQPDPEGRGVRRAFKLALEQSGIKAEDIDYINTHGTSTPANDVSEAKSIKAVFGKNTYVSSTKGAIGHLLGAAGGVESIFCALAIKEQTIPPTINLDEIDPECEGINHVTETIETEVNYAINANYGFGGHNTVIVFKKYE